MDKVEKILKEYDDRYEEYNTCSGKLKDLIMQILEDVNYHSIEVRVKNRDSLKTKIISKDHYDRIEDITDIIGVRIITYFSDQVDEIAKLMEREFVLDKQNSIDKRKVADPNYFGYSSLHYVMRMNGDRMQFFEYRCFEKVKFEIQIRTILQHAWAEIEHDLGYKTNRALPKQYIRDFSRLSGLLELADMEFYRIKKEIDEYKTKAENNMMIREESAPYNIEINSITMSVILDNSIYKNISEEMKKQLNLRISAEVNFDSVELFDRLNLVKITNMNKLLHFMMEYKNEIVKFCCQYLNRYRRGANGFFTLSQGFMLSFVVHYYAILKLDDSEFNIYLNKFILDESINDFLLDKRSQMRQS